MFVCIWRVLAVSVVLVVFIVVLRFVIYVSVTLVW